MLEFDGRVLSTVHGPRWRLVLIGAGQLTRYLTEMARMLDYHVVVIDPREEYAAGWDLAAVPLNRGMPDDVVRELELDGHSALIALTHDPKLDDLALMEGLKSAAFYVGAIGSKKNNDARRERLKEFDVSVDEIARLRGPVGLYIGSKTPPEIAVAILAEMTAVRHGVKEPSWAAKPERRFDRLRLRSQTDLKIVGLLLAAGSATRFGSDKLRHALPHGVPIAVQAARHLKLEIARVVAVVRPDSPELKANLESEGCEVVVCENAAEGMGASLACAARAAGEADGYLIALGDMPFVRRTTIAAVRDALAAGAPLAAPYFRARRGHPVALVKEVSDKDLSRRATRERSNCSRTNERLLVKIPVGDPGTIRDIDTLDDLAPPLRI